MLRKPNDLGPSRSLWAIFCVSDDLSFFLIINFPALDKIEFIQWCWSFKALAFMMLVQTNLPYQDISLNYAKMSTNPVSTDPNKWNRT